MNYFLISKKLSPLKKIYLANFAMHEQRTLCRMRYDKIKNGRKRNIVTVPGVLRDKPGFLPAQHLP